MALNFCNNNSLSAITALPASISGGDLNLISTQTASSSSTISFTSGIDSTYKEYIFKFINIHPANDDPNLQLNFSADGGSNYNVTKTTSVFMAYHDEADSSTTLQVLGSLSLGQSTAVQKFAGETGNANDECMVGTLHLFNPSSTTFSKHFIARTNSYDGSNLSVEIYTAGYANTTSAIDAVQFSFSSGSIESGVIKLYGVS